MALLGVEISMLCRQFCIALVAMSSSISILPATKSNLIYCAIKQYNAGKNDHYIQTIPLTWRCWLLSPIVYQLPSPLSSLQTKNSLVEVVNQCTSTTRKRDAVCIACRWPLCLPVFFRLRASCLSFCYGLQSYKLQSYGTQPYKLAAMHHALFQSDRMVQNAIDIWNQTNLYILSMVFLWPNLCSKAHHPRSILNQFCYSA